MALIEWKNCVFTPRGQGHGLQDVCLAIEPGDVIALASDANEDAHLLLRGLASLDSPQSGVFLHQGAPLDFSDYRKLLPYKSRVGYIASDAALLASRTLGENLMLRQYYFSDNGDGGLEPEIQRLATFLELDAKLGLAPAHAHKEDIRLAIIAREMGKQPDLLLVERPGEGLDADSAGRFLDLIGQAADRGTAMILYSFNKPFIEKTANRRMHINRGCVEVSRLAAAGSQEK